MRRRRPPTTLLAGWLFADSLLAITFVALGSEGSTATPAAAPTATPTASAPAVAGAPAAGGTASPTATAATDEPGVEQAPFVVHVPAGGLSDAALAARFAARVKEHRRAAFVLTFGTETDPGAGVALAEQVNGQLLAAVPSEFRGSTQRSFWQAVDSGDAAGSSVVEVYEFTTTGAS